MSLKNRKGGMELLLPLLLTISTTSSYIQFFTLTAVNTKLHHDVLTQIYAERKFLCFSVLNTAPDVLLCS